MVVRQARMIALLMLATIAASALGAVVWFGPNTPFVKMQSGVVLSTACAALTHVGYALLLSLAFDRAARVRRWRRNIVRAGGTFAVTWIGVLTLILVVQSIAWSQALGHPIDREAALATAVALLVLLKANLLPKSRPAWFNGTTLPFFAQDTAIWRRIHHASAIRLAGIAATILLCVALLPGGTTLRPIVGWLLGIEVGIATLHGLWLGGPPWSRSART